MKSTGLVLAAGGIALANEVIFAPLAEGSTAPKGLGAPTAVGSLVSGLNWRIVPATAVLALALGGLEKIAPGFAVGLAGMAVLAVLIVPVGNAPTVTENIIKALGL